MVVINYPPCKRLVLHHSQTVIDNGQEGEKRWAEELRAHKDRNELETALFSLSIY
jgi:hypothetical protein